MMTGLKTYLHKTVVNASLASINLAPFANTDYQLDSWKLNPSLKSEARYPDLTGGGIVWQGLKFKIPASYIRRKPIQWTVYTSCNNPERSLEVPLKTIPSRNLYLVVDGCQITAANIAPVVEAQVLYEDGSSDRHVLNSNEHLWAFEEEAFGLYIPSDFLVWKQKEGQSLNVVTIPLEVNKAPQSIIFSALNGPKEGGITLFAIHQEKKNPSLKRLIKETIIQPIKQLL